MKKNVFILLVLALCLSLFSNVVSADSSVTSSIKSDNFVSKKLAQNTLIMNEVLAKKAQNKYCEDSFAQVSISIDKKSAAITLFYNGVTSTSILDGTYNEIHLADRTGYVGVYEGFISPISGSSTVNTNEKKPIIADITFTDSDIFAVLTLGYANETMNPEILFYGDYTTNIATISNTDATQSLEEVQKKQIVENETISPLAVDGECKYQGYDIVNLGSHLAGVLSVYHANELKNQGVMSTYVKVNTRSDLVKEYIEDDLGFGSYTVTTYPDTFNISICGNNNNLHAITNSYLPQNNTTSATISIPYYAGSVIGVQFFPIEITMSSTTVTPSRYSSSSQHPNNKLSWEIYKRNGWSSTTFDGGLGSKTGMTVASSYTYEGNVASNISRSMTSTASIRYEYWIMIMDNLSKYHLSTGNMSKTTTVTICP